MRTTKKYPVLATIEWPDGKRLEVRIPKSGAHQLMAVLEWEEERKRERDLLTKKEV